MRKALVFVVVLFVLVLVVMSLWMAQRGARGRRVAHGGEVRAPAEVVRDVLADVESQPRWRADIAEVTRIGPLAWAERSRRGQITRFEAVTPPSTDGWSFRFVGQGFEGTWRARLTRSATGTRVDVEEEVITRGVLGAVLSAVFVDLDALVRTWLADLSRECDRRAAGAAGSESPPGVASPRSTLR